MYMHACSVQILHWSNRCPHLHVAKLELSGALPSQQELLFRQPGVSAGKHHSAGDLQWQIKASSVSVAMSNEQRAMVMSKAGRGGGRKSCGGSIPDRSLALKRFLLHLQQECAPADDAGDAVPTWPGASRFTFPSVSRSSGRPSSQAAALPDKNAPAIFMWSTNGYCAVQYDTPARLVPSGERLLAAFRQPAASDGWVLAAEVAVAASAQTTARATTAAAMRHDAGVKESEPPRFTRFLTSATGIEPEWPRRARGLL